MDQCRNAPSKENMGHKPEAGDDLRPYNIDSVRSSGSGKDIYDNDNTNPIMYSTFVSSNES